MTISYVVLVLVFLVVLTASTLLLEILFDFIHTMRWRFKKLEPGSGNYAQIFKTPYKVN